MNAPERLKLFFFIAIRDGLIAPIAVERIIGEHVEKAEGFPDGVNYAPEAKTLEGYAEALTIRLLGAS